MTLQLNQQVRVRIAQVYDSTFADQSIGQVYDEVSSTWLDVVWIDILNSGLHLLEFGDVECYGIVINTALTRGSTTMPCVMPLYYITGGNPPEEYDVVSGWDWATAYARMKLKYSGTVIQTNLPSYGLVDNYSLGDASEYGPFVGWVGKLPIPLEYETGHRLRSVHRTFLTNSTEFASREGYKWSGDLSALNTHLGSIFTKCTTNIVVHAYIHFTRNSGEDTYIVDGFFSLFCQNDFTSSIPGVVGLIFPLYSLPCIRQGETMTVSAQRCSTTYPNCFGKNYDTPDHILATTNPVNLSDGVTGSGFTAASIGTRVTSSAGGTATGTSSTSITDGETGAFTTLTLTASFVVDNGGALNSVALSAAGTGITVVAVDVTGGMIVN